MLWVLIRSTSLRCFIRSTSPRHFDEYPQHTFSFEYMDTPLSGVLQYFGVVFDDVIVLAKHSG